MSITLTKCRNCFGVGKDLVKENGLCNYCTQKLARNGQALNDSTLSGKRERPFEEERVSKAKIDILLKEAEELDVPELDGNGVKKMLLSVERAITKNMQLRMKYPDAPGKFLESEMELDASLKTLLSLAAAPEYYDILIQSATLQSLLSLLSHENSSIAMDVVNFFLELIKDENVGNSTEDLSSAIRVIEAISKEGGIPLFLHNLKRLVRSTDDEDRAGVFTTLEFFEALISLHGSQIVDALLTTEVTENPSTSGVKSTAPYLLHLLIHICRQSAYSEMKSSAAELLSIILASSPTGSSFLHQEVFYPFPQDDSEPAEYLVTGIEILLESVNAVRRVNPVGTDEKETIENIFGALHTALLKKENQDNFRLNEGFELMIRVIQGCGYTRFNGIKSISYAIANNIANCERLINAGGLKVLIPAFLGKGLALTRNFHGSTAVKDEEEHTVSILAQCIQHLPSLKAQSPEVDPKDGTDIKTGIERLRLLRRFLANQEVKEKVERLVDLHVRYSKVMEDIDATADDVDLNEYDEDELDRITSAIAGEATHGALVRQILFEKKVANGLLTLQKVDVLISSLIVSDTSSIRKLVNGEDTPPTTDDNSTFSMQIRSKLYERGSSVLSILEVLTNQLEILSASDTEESAKLIEYLSGTAEQLAKKSGL